MSNVKGNIPLSLPNPMLLNQNSEAFLQDPYPLIYSPCLFCFIKLRHLPPPPLAQ